MKVPFVQIALGIFHSYLGLNLMEIEAKLTAEAEEPIRRRLPQEYLMAAKIICEPDDLIAPHVRNESVFEIARWAYHLAHTRPEDGLTFSL